MHYEKLEKVLAVELPINRKEKFYTATILPALLFHNGLSNLFTFLKQIKGFPDEINEKSTDDEFLFYTEYNLRQSAGGKSFGAIIDTDSGETPDVIIEILKPKRTFVVIEAKMFQNLSQDKFDEQIKDQRRTILNPLKNKYCVPDNRMFHVALVPSKLNFIDNEDYQVLNWEFFLDNRNLDVESSYFYSFLKYALDNYDHLVADSGSGTWGQASTVKGYMTGRCVYESVKSGERIWIGRKDGRSVIAKDVENGRWSSFRYSTNDHKPTKGQKGNWISGEEFVDIVEKYKG